MGSDPILQNVPLAPLTTIGVGGVARWFTRAERVADIVAKKHLAADPVPQPNIVEAHDVVADSHQVGQNHGE